MRRKEGVKGGEQRGFKDLVRGFENALKKASGVAVGILANMGTEDN
jgi:hypothetical protein